VSAARPFATLALAAALTACTMAPRYERPAAPVPTSYENVAAATASAAPHRCFLGMGNPVWRRPRSGMEAWHVTGEGLALAAFQVVASLQKRPVGPGTTLAPVYP